MDELTIRFLGKQNKGSGHKRTKFKNPISSDPNREKAFSKNWIKINKKQAGINSGQGILQDLFIDEKLGTLHPRVVILKVSRRERFIVATIIQWLGSNCGFSFLNDCLRDCGYKIVKDDNP